MIPQSRPKKVERRSWLHAEADADAAVVVVHNVGAVQSHGHSGRSRPLDRLANPGS